MPANSEYTKEGYLSVVKNSKQSGFLPGDGKHKVGEKGDN